MSSFLAWAPRSALVLLLVLGIAVLGAGGWETKPHPKVEWALLELAAGPTAPEEAAPAGVEAKDGRVKAVVEHAPYAPDISARLTALGARVEATYAGLTVAWLPSEALLQAAALPDIIYIRRPHAPVRLSMPAPRLVSEGVTLLGASLFHSKGILAQEVRVAVIDVGFGGLSQSHRVGEIDADAIVWTRDYTGDGLEAGGPHGTGVAQIVHNIAPEAELYLARIGNEVQLALAVQELIDHEVDIVVHSVGWVNTDFGDGTGVLADIVGEALAESILWVNAAGNHAQQHWLGTPEIGADGWLEFEPSIDELNLIVDIPGQIQVALTWDEWPEATSDLDLYLFDQEGNQVAASRGNQGGGAPPTEMVSHTAERGRYSVRVRASHAPEPIRIEIFSLGHYLDPHVPESSILAPGNVDEVLTVGAIGLRSWDTGPQQPYSSQGPTNDGRLKPDIMGPDAVTNFAYPRFSGTSAAAPHVAGMAALLISQARREGGELRLDDLRELLIRWAVDMGELGPDPVYGHGRLRVLLEQARAERAILTPDGEVAPGDTVSVEVTVRMPATQVGGLELRESVPKGLRAQIEDDGAADATTEDDEELVWIWRALAPGQVRTVYYMVTLPLGTVGRRYTFSGELNRTPVEGESTLTVQAVPEEPPEDVKALASPNPVDQGRTARFSVDGTDPWTLRLYVHDTSGRRVYDSGWQPGPTYQWHLQDDRGRIVAGGLYLYWLEIRTIKGETLRTSVERLLVLR